ncbi:MAG: hypothetical protein CBB72_002790 [Muricauda sp. TMED12]|nr:MAG: hypothetical protein CBB72_002790 [Muricauda sp. TMED12]
MISNRQLIEYCCKRLDILFFIGHDTNEELPWHSNIIRMYLLFPQEVFEKMLTKEYNNHRTASRRRSAMQKSLSGLPHQRVLFGQEAQEKKLSIIYYRSVYEHNNVQMARPQGR